ncbi:MAG: hypothetical protein QMD36_02215 [Candidatus Aenigmarchaeota archaeon]|nr:hypothetical protein [Candidatus Aenigmarchaeota archaeon]
MDRMKGAGKIDEFAFVLIAGLLIIIVMFLMWGVPTEIQIPVVSPTSQSLTIKRGETESFFLQINVTSDLVTLKAKGIISNWIKFSNNNFESAGLSSVKVTVTVPYDTEERDYYGTIEVESAEGGKAIVSLTVTVIREVEKVEEFSRSHYIGDFTVTYAAGSETVRSKTNVEVSKDKKVNMGGAIERDMNLVTDGFIIIDIYYTNSEGNLIIKFNNQVIFNQKVLPGRIRIPIDREYLSEYNVIEISTSVPGWKFWVDSIYKIDKVEFGINFFGNLEKKEVFTVSRDEIINFKEGRVEFYVESVGGDGYLTVKINDRKVYEGKTTGRVSLKFEYVDVGLVSGENTISFSTEIGTTYKIEKAKITIFYRQP